jgi:aspartokinase
MPRWGGEEAVKTAAVYWEPKIKTYGFQVTTDLSLLELVFKSVDITEWGFKLHSLGDLGISVSLVLIPYSCCHELCLYLLVKRQWEDELLQEIRKMMEHGAGDTISMTSPLEMIHFHGPHFGDRYGIAEAAFKALRGKAIQILLVGCSVSTICLVFPHGKAREARNLLEEAFEIPRRKRAHGKKRRQNLGGA